MHGSAVVAVGGSETVDAGRPTAPPARRLSGDGP
jgi:hypothetical protein